MRPKSSRPWRRRRNRERDVGAGELRLPQQRFLAADLLGRYAGAVGKLELDRRPLVGNEDVELDEIGAFVGRRVHDRETRRAEPPLRCARRHVARARVRSARLLRSERAPARTPRLRSSRRSSRAPSSGTCASRPARGTARASRLRREPAAAPRSARASVPRARTRLSGRFGRRRRPAAGSRAHPSAARRASAPDPLADASARYSASVPTTTPVRNARREVRRERHVVGADHAEHGRRRETTGEKRSSNGSSRGSARDVEEVGRVPVARRQVLGDDSGAVQPFPHEPVEVDRRGNAPPDHRRLDSGERAGSAASARRDRTCPGGSRRASRFRSSAARASPASRLRNVVSPSTRNSSISVCHGPMREPPGRHECANPLLRLRPDLEVVVDRRELAVECEPHAARRSRAGPSTSSTTSTSEIRNDWNGRYHSRSQCVCGTRKTLRS